MTSASLARSTVPDTEWVPAPLDAIEAFRERKELSSGTAHPLAVVMQELAPKGAVDGATGEGAARLEDPEIGGFCGDLARTVTRQIAPPRAGRRDRVTAPFDAA